MDRQEELRQWFAIAEEDLGVAKHLVSTYHPPRLKEYAIFVSNRWKRI